MKILILNWRDIKNPAGGGAEVLTHEMAKRWVKSGHQVTQFSAGFSGGKREEMVDGVKIIRKGIWFTIHLLAVIEYFKKFKGKVDVIIDEVHWLPFWTKFYVEEKKVVLVCEVAANLWDKILPWPLNLIGRFLERIYLFFYRGLPFLAISPSSALDLKNRGIPKKNITILPMGITLPTNFTIYSKEKTPTLIFLGRLYPLKGPDVAILALSLVVKKIPNAKLWVVGTGQDKYVNYLTKLVEREGLVGKVIFFGHVTEEKKFELLSRVHLILVPSLHEGWGLIVAEAQACATPAVVYNVAGLRNVLDNEVTGKICQNNTPENLAKNAISLIKNQSVYQKFQDNCVMKSKKYSWYETAKVAFEFISSR